MKKLFLIVMVLVFVLSINSAWAAKEDELSGSAGISVWVPTLKYTMNTTNSGGGTIPSFSSSFIIGPKVDLMFDKFFFCASYLLPVSGFQSTQDLGSGFTWTNTQKISWLDLKLGYMIGRYIGIYGGYINNSDSITTTVTSIPSVSSTITISGPGAGILINAPLGKSVIFYANGSYIFGTLNDKNGFLSNTGLAANYTCAVMDIEGGLGYKFLDKQVAQVMLGWRYQINNITAGSTSVLNSQTFSGVVGSVVYNFSAY